MNQRPLFVDEAIKIVIEHAASLGTEAVPLPASEGGILAVDLHASMDIPSFSKSMMDGFAIRSIDVSHASFSSPVVLHIVDEVMAGQISFKTCGPGEAIRIMTGAPIPQGADAVCRFEQTKDGFQQDIAEVAILTPIQSGEAITYCGEDIKKGNHLLRRGSEIGPAEASILATFGIAEVPIFKKPDVNIVSTGSELVDFTCSDDEVPVGKLRNSNSVMVAQIVKQNGGIPHICPLLPDQPEIISEYFQELLGKSDILVFTGGVSVGDKDYIPHILQQQCVDIKFWKVMIRPGHPVLFGVYQQTLIFGLSGNPAACFVNAMVFLVPAIRRMNGRPIEQASLPVMQAKLIGDMTQRPVKHTRFLRAEAYTKQGEVFVDIRRAQSTAILSSFLGSNCLVRVDSDKILQQEELVPIYVYGQIFDRP